MLNIGNIFIISGIVLLSGLAVTMLDGKVKWFGIMSLDFKFKNKSIQFSTPFGTMIILSMILSFLINLFFRWFKYIINCITPLLLFIGLVFWSCTSDSKNDKSKTSSITLNEYNIEQLIQIDETLSFNHKTTSQTANGKIFQVLENDKKVYLGQLINGKPDGLWIKWSENGIKIEEGNYKNGLLEGYFALYYPNGSKSLEGSILHGKKNGLFAMYHENGIRSFRGEYFDGEGKGKWVYYNEEGAKIRKKDCDFEECK